MEVGTEISQKIRSAIKAKLMELGAYVDDELPDYIMVMVANKKNKSQMKTDLSLFLGTNTDTFTSWLHGLLGKLQTITVESTKDKPAEPEKSKKEKKKDKSGLGSQKSKKVGKDKSRKRKSSKDDGDNAPKAKAAMSETTEKENTSAEINNSQTGDSEIVDNETQGLNEGGSSQVGDDEPEASEGVEANSVKQTHVQEEFEDVRQLLVAATPGDELAKELDAVEEEISNVKKSHPSQSKGASNKARTSNSSVATDDSQREQKSKKKVPSSVVATVCRDEDDEEYNPFNPAVGSVASVVKVTSRKTSFPPSMQANRQENSGDAIQDSDTGFDQEDQQTKDHLPQTVNLEIVKRALTDVLEKFQFGHRQDEIGYFSHCVERTLRQLDHRAFIQAKSRILQVLASFDVESLGTSRQLSCSIHNKGPNGETGLLTSNPTDSRQVEGTRTSDKSGIPERIIFNSKSNKSSVLTSTDQGSEFYRNFVSSILKPTPQQSNAEGSNSNTQDGSNTPTQPLVSSTKLEFEPPRAGLAGSRSKSVLPVSTSSPSNPSHAPSPSSTSSPSVAQSAIVPKVSSADPGFHRLRSQILVDSLHVKRRPDAATSSSSTPLLQHAWKKRQAGDKDEGDLGLGEGGSNSPSSMSPQHYSGEALKVLAKNLRVTIINRQAKGVEESSSGDDSSSDDDSDDEDSSDGNKEAEEATGDLEKDQHFSNIEKIDRT